MKYIGLIKTDDLPSTSIGLRVSEMAKLGFSQIILYAKTRTTVAKQFRKGTVISNEQKLKEEIAKQGDCLVVIAAKHSVDASGIKALGEPKEMECRCLTGQRFVGCISEGERSVVKVFEYDRRRGVSRFDRGDSGDVKIDVPNNKGLMVIRSVDFIKMLKQGDSFISAGVDFQNAADATGVSVVCVDPITAGVSWHSGKIHDEKKPINMVYGEKVITTKKHDVQTQLAPAENDPVKNVANLKLPVLPVVFLTHNRTAVACHCLDAMCKNLKYSGAIKWIICDDRSDPGHIEAMENVLRDNGIDNYAVKCTNDNSWGLGASMNNGLKEAFSISEIVLTTEDDFLLIRDFNITEFVQIILENNVAGIRFGNLLTTNSSGMHTVKISESRIKGFLTVEGGDVPNLRHRYVFNNQVMLRHKRIYDKIGLYDENCRAEDAEELLNVRYLKATNNGTSRDYSVIYPKLLNRDVAYDNGLFRHIGKSTLNHKCPTSSGYEYLNSDEADTNARLGKTKSFSKTIPFFRIITPVKNSSWSLRRMVASIASQTFNDYVVIVCDDHSNDNDRNTNRKTVSELGTKGVFVENNGERFAGASRNMALDLQIQSYYTLFIDADDELASPTVLEALYSFIHKCKFPDCVLLPYIHNGKKVYPQLQSDTTNDMAGFMFIAAWTKCTKSSIVQKFGTGTRVAEDVVQHYKTMDTVSTVRTLPCEFVKYNTDGDLTTFGTAKKRNRQDIETVSGFFRTAANLLDSEWYHDNVRKCVEKHIKLYTTGVIPKRLADLNGGVAKNLKRSSEQPVLPPKNDKAEMQSVENENGPIHVCLIGDDGYCDKIVALIQGIREAQSRRTIVHVVGFEMSEKSINLIRSQTGDSVEVTVENASREYVDKCMDAGGYERDKKRYTVPPTGLLKFFLPEILPNLDKVLYIDGDIMLLGRIDSLFDTDISEVFCAAVPDIGSITMLGKETFKIMQGNPRYFNSGVLLLNLKRLRDNKVSDILYRTKKGLSDRSLMDQDVFNIVFDKNTKLLPCRYNHMTSLHYRIKSGGISLEQVNKLYGTKYTSLKEAANDVVLLHFAGNKKPWKPELPEWRRLLNKGNAR